MRDRGRRVVIGRLEREEHWLAAVRSRPALADPVREVERKQEQVLALRDRARRCLSSALDRSADELSHTRARLLALSPAATLDRGYAIVQHADSSVVRSESEVKQGEELHVRLADGHLTVRAERPDAAGGPQAASAKR
jgi:exodeoxyribonuclease VII large subunit